MFTDERKGIVLYIPYVILMPFYNSIVLNILVFLCFLVSKHRKGELHLWEITPFKPVIIFYILFLFLIPFQKFTPIGFQLNSLFEDFVSAMILPLMIWYEVKTDETTLELYKRIVIVCVVIASLYGLVLTQTSGYNPYLSLLMESIGIDAVQDIENYAKAEGSGRIFGRISSFFIHPMTFAFFLGLSIIYVFSISNKCLKNDKIGLLIILLLNIVFCGVRSVIGGLIVVVVVWYFFQNKFRLSVRYLVYLVFILILISQIPYLATYIGSIMGGGSDDISGSSIEMRLFQYAGCLQEFEDSPIFGKGYAWHKYYLDEFGDHPILFAFESLVYIVLCDGGLLGVIIWILFAVLIYKYAKHNAGENFVFVLMLFSFYFSYSCITGEYGYMKFFMLFYILIFCEYISNKNCNTRESYE